MPCSPQFHRGRGRAAVLLGGSGRWGAPLTAPEHFGAGGGGAGFFPACKGNTRAATLRAINHRVGSGPARAPTALGPHRGPEVRGGSEWCSPLQAPTSLLAQPQPLVRFLQ